MFCVNQIPEIFNPGFSFLGEAILGEKIKRFARIICNSIVICFYRLRFSERFKRYE